MNYTVQTINIDLVVNTAVIEREMEQARRAVQRSMQSISGELQTAQQNLDQATAKVRNLSRAFAGIAKVAFTATLRSFNELVQEADRLDKVSDAVGLTVEELQGLRFAAEQVASVTDRTLDASMQRFAQGVGEAARGGGELKKTIEDLGIELFNTDGTMRRQIDILGDFADQVASAGSEQTQLSLAVKAFGSEGAGLVNLLRQGSDGLEQLSEQFSQTGAMIDTETVDSFVQFNDALNVLRNQAKSFGVAIFADLIPPLAAYADYIANTEQGQQLLADALDDIATAAKVAGAVIGTGFLVAMGKAVTQMLIAEVRVAKLTVLKLQLLGASKAAAVGMATFGRAVSIATGPIGIAIGILSSLGLAYLSLRDKIQEAEPELDEFDLRLQSIISGTVSFQTTQILDDLYIVAGRVAEINNEIESLSAKQIGFERFTIEDTLEGINPSTVSDRIAELVKEKEHLGNAAIDLNRRLQNLNQGGGINDIGDDADDAAKKLEGWRRELENVEARLAGPAEQAVLEFNRKVDELVKAYPLLNDEQDTFNRLLRAHTEELHRALGVNEDLARQQEEARRAQEEANRVQEEAQSSYEAATDELNAKIAAQKGDVDALREWENQQFKNNLLAKVFGDLTEEQMLLFKDQRIELEKLIDEYHEGAEAGVTFAERVADALQSILPNEIADAVGEGLEQGLVKGIGSIDGQQVLDGEWADIGESLARNALDGVGRAVGQYFGGSIGGEIGALVADIIGDAVFGGSTPKFQVRGVDGPRDIGTDVTIDTALATTEFAFRKIEDETRRQVQEAFVEFDKNIASFIRNENQLSQIEDALNRFAVSSRSDGEDLAVLLQKRFDVIVGTFPDFVQSIVEFGNSLEEQVQRLADLLAIESEIRAGRGLGLDGLGLGGVIVPGPVLPLPPVGPGQPGPPGLEPFPTIPRQAVASVKELGEFASVLSEGGDAASLTNPILRDTAMLVAELVRPAETLLEAFDRIRRSLEGLDTVARITGITVGETREAIIRFADGLTEIASMDEVEQLFANLFERFYTEAELAESVIERETARAEELLGQIGVDFDQSLLEAENFRALFESLLPTLSPEELVTLLRAGDAIGLVMDAEQQLAQAREQAAEEQAEMANELAGALAELVSEVDDEIIGLSASSERLEFIEIQRQFDSLRQRAIETGAAVQTLDRIEALRALRLRQLTSELETSLSSLADEFRGVTDTTAQVANVATTAANSMAGLAGSIRQTIISIQGSQGTSNLSPVGQRDFLQAQFDSAIATGNFQLANQIASQLAQAIRAVGASSADADARIADLLTDLELIEAQARAAEPPTGAQVNAVNDSVGQVVQESRRQAEIALEAIEKLSLLVEISGQSAFEIAERLSVPLGEMVAALIDVENFSADQVAELGALATQLGVSLGALGDQIGIAVGNLADTESLLYQALEDAIVGLPPEIADPLLEQLADVEDAADVAGLEAAVSDLAPEFRDALAPFFDSIDFSDTAAEQLAVQELIKNATQASAESLTNIEASFAEGNMPNYEVGTDYVPQTGPAILQRGGALLPAHEAVLYRRGELPNQASNAEVVSAISQMQTSLTQRLDTNNRELARRNQLLERIERQQPVRMN